MRREIEEADSDWVRQQKLLDHLWQQKLDAESDWDNDYYEVGGFQEQWSKTPSFTSPGAIEIGGCADHLGDLPEPDPKVSLLNEPIAYRDTGEAALLHKWPKGRPLHAVIAECLANVELLLAQLECGVRVADKQRELVRELYVSTQRQREILAAVLRLELE
jgi:hypothetical protein